MTSSALAGRSCLGIAAAALGASASGNHPGTAPAEALHTFTLDSGASRCFFCDSTALTLLPAPVPVRLADPSGGPAIASSSTILPCLAVPSGSLSGLHLPSFSTNLVSTAALQDAMVTTTTPGGQRVSICTCTRTGRHLATFDKSVPFFHLFPYRSAPSLPPPLFLAPGPPPVDPLPPQGPAPSGVSQVDPLPHTAHVQIAVVSGAAPRAASGGAELRGVGSEGAGSGGAEPEGVEPGGAESEGAKPGGAESEGTESEGAEPRGAASSGGPAGASPRLSSQQLRELLVQRPHYRIGAPGAGERGDTRAGGAAVTNGAGDPTEPRAAGAGGAGAGVAGVGVVGVGGPGTGGAGVAGAGAVDLGAGGAGGTVRPRPYFVPLLQQVLGVPSSTGLPPPFLCPPPDQSQPPLQPASPLRVPSPYTEQSGGLTELREPASRAVLPVPTARRTPRSRPPPVPGTHTMALRPSSVPLRVPLPAPPESSLPKVPEPQSNRARAASPTVAHLLATAVTDPSFESTAASALVAELLDFAAACRLDYASALVAESVPASPPSVGGDCGLGTDVLADRQEDFECLAAAVPRFASLLLAPEGDPDAPDIPTPRSYAEAITGPYSTQWQAAMDAEMASRKSTGTYIDEVPPSGVNIVDDMWIFRVKRPLGSPPAFKARYVAQGFRQRQGIDYFQTFSPTPKMTTLWVLLNVAALRDYELHSLDFSTAFLQGSLHEEIWLRLPPGFTRSFLTGTHWSLRRPLYGLRQAPREWHDTLKTTLAALGFVPSTADPSLFLRTDTSLPPFYVLVYVDDLVFAMADTKALTLVKSFSYSASSTPCHSSLLCLPATCSQLHLRTSPTSGIGLVLGGRGPVVLTGHGDASWADDSATQRSSQGYTFSLGSGSVSWQSTRSSSVLSSSCEAEIYAGAMAAQELRWLTYLLTDLGEQPRSPPVLYQRGQLRLAYVATRANTADVFTKALPPGHHQPFAPVLGLQLDTGRPTVVWVDNQSAIAVAEGLGMKGNLKHMERRYVWLQQMVKRGDFSKEYTTTTKQPADFLAKALHFLAFSQCSVKVRQVRLADVDDNDDDVQQLASCPLARLVR
ncbi:unnamed protein product [Closterium sp. NIES-53]